jgi:hypothetical protein
MTSNGFAKVALANNDVNKTMNDVMTARRLTWLVIKASAHIGPNSNSKPKVISTAVTNASNPVLLWYVVIVDWTCSGRGSARNSLAVSNG